MTPGDKRRKISQVKHLSLSDIAAICRSAHMARDSCLVALLYLSGRRIGEVLELKKRDFNFSRTRGSFQTFNEKVWRKERDSRYSYPRTIDRIKMARDSEGKKTFEKYQDTIFNESITPTWSLISKSGILLNPFILPYLTKLEPTDYIFKSLRADTPIGYSRAYIIIREMAPHIWPHLLRHERFSALAEVFREDPVSMHRFTFHKRFESTLEYIRSEKAEELLDNV